MPKPQLTDPWAEFKKVTEPSVPRLIWCGAGEPASGKTHFALSAPGPLAIFNFDYGLRGVVDKFMAHKDIYPFEYPWGAVEKKESTEIRVIANEVLERFEADFNKVVGIARTIIIDKESELWELIRYAALGGPKGDYRDFDAMNARMRYYFESAKRKNIHFGCLQGMTNDWLNKTIVGRKRVGWDATPSQVDVFMEHSFVADGEDSAFKVRVIKARGPNSEFVQGREFTNLSFPELGQILYPDSSEDVWL